MNSNLEAIKERIMENHKHLQEVNKFLIELYDLINEFEKETKK